MVLSKKKGGATQIRMRTSKAANLVDKNSKTMVKLMQLLDIMQTPGAHLADTDGFITRRIEKLKMRINRRLIKLSKWADTPEEERQPLAPDPRQMYTMDTNRISQLNQRATTKLPIQNRSLPVSDSIYVQQLMKVNNAVLGNNRMGQPQQGLFNNTSGQAFGAGNVRVPYGGIPSHFQNPRGLPSAYSTPLQSYGPAPSTSIDNSNLSAILARQRQVVMETSNVFRNQTAARQAEIQPSSGPVVGAIAEPVIFTNEELRVDKVSGPVITDALPTTSEK